MTASEHRGTWDDIRSLGALGRAWAVGIVVFSAARALIAWPTLGRNDGFNPWIFLLIDIVTAVPYGVGQALTVKILRDRDRSPMQALPWAVVVAVTFLAPYIYIFAVAGSMPKWAYLGVLGWMCLFGLLAVVRMIRQVRAPRHAPSEEPTAASPDPQAVSTTKAAESPDSRSTS